MNDDVQRLIADPTGEAARDLAAMGGVLVCLSCNASQPIGGADQVGSRLHEGWPKCCGYTMRWYTARELGALSTSPLDEEVTA